MFALYGFYDILLFIHASETVALQIRCIQANMKHATVDCVSKASTHLQAASVSVNVYTPQVDRENMTFMNTNPGLKIQFHVGQYFSRESESSSGFFVSFRVKVTPFLPMTGLRSGYIKLSVRCTSRVVWLTLHFDRL